MADVLVQKYGGSSLADVERIRHVARRIAREHARGQRLVVVVSAMGDTTDELLAMAARLTDEPDPRELDVLLATGEHTSGTLVAMALHAIGVPAISLTGAQAGIRTDTSHGRARIANLDPQRVRHELDTGRVVIVAGFQGATETSLVGEVTTLGRGGSDTTAVALAAALGAVRCEIHTDVEGIYTADPRVVHDARLLDVIGYEEMLELAGQGAQVMQARAVELGWVNSVVIAVRSSFSTSAGTLIKEDPEVEQRNKVRGLAMDRHVAKVTLVAVPDRPGVARAVFEPLADAGINVDMIVQNVSHAGTTDLSFTINATELARARRLLDPVVRQLGAREVTTDSAVAKVSIVGAGIQNAPGYAARMFAALAEEGINIEMISTSEIRITCIIAEDDLDKAARALHAAFALEQPEAVETSVRAG
jgi:aspartate kinase